MKKSKKVALVAALAAVVGLGGISAYFTDGDTATNTFTVGKVSLDLQEPNWTPPTDIVPNEEFKKDPQIKNDGVNDEYVFVEVAVPYANVVTANDDGSKNAAADTELFSYTVNSGWVEVGTATKDTIAKTVTHLYAYGTNSAMTALTKDATTPAVFDAVKFANVVEDQNLEGSTLNIVVNAYGIQTTAINNGDTSIDGTTAAGKVAPADVWAVLSTQAPTTTVTVTEDAKTDVKQ